MEAAHKKEAGKATTFSDYDHSNFYYGAGEDPLNLLGPFSDWYAEAIPNGYYLYSEPLQSAPGTADAERVRLDGEQRDAEQGGVEEEGGRIVGGGVAKAENAHGGVEDVGRQHGAKQRAAHTLVAQVGEPLRVSSHPRAAGARVTN